MCLQNGSFVRNALAQVSNVVFVMLVSTVLTRIRYSKGQWWACAFIISGLIADFIGKWMLKTSNGEAAFQKKTSGEDLMMLVNMGAMFIYATHVNVMNRTAADFG